MLENGATILKAFNDMQELIGGLQSSLDRVDLGDDGSCVDFAAQLRLHMKAVEKIEKALTKDLTPLATMDEPTPQGVTGRLQGIRFYATVTHSVIWTFDSKAVKTEMGQDWYDARCKQGTRVTVKYMEGE